LHPVVRRLEGGREVARVHLLENLYGEWRDERLHREPLVRFFEAEVGSGRGVVRTAVRAMAG
jgi:hypothetical protein